MRSSEDDEWFLAGALPVEEAFFRELGTASCRLQCAGQPECGFRFSDSGVVGQVYEEVVIRKVRLNIVGILIQDSGHIRGNRNVLEGFTQSRTRLVQSQV